MELSQSWPAWSSRRWLMENIGEGWFYLKNAWLNKRANIMDQTGYLQYSNNPDQTEFAAQFKLEKVDLTTSSQKPTGRNVKLFPNPVSNVLSIQTPSNHLAYIRILNLQGIKQREILSPGNKLITINMHGFLPGIYIVQIAGKDEYPQNFKLVKT